MFSFGVQLGEELFKFRLLLRRKNRANLVAAFLSNLFELGIGLVMNAFHFGVPFQEDGVELFRLVARES